MEGQKISATFSDEVEKASVSFWYVKEGDHVEKEQPLVEFVTEKTSFTYSSPITCKVIKILANEGEEVKSGQDIAEVEIQ
ncbi:MAG TPA: lipoyl domain-containing protein [bacterium]|nr:lipoyl domain-containing protein [bacterium]HOL35516.1 lipoyl domain-containing protein [bacterium]HPP08539.1 lipoyl domain-containing protein [bacterium]